MMAAHSATECCQLCQQRQWQPINTLCSGVWDKTQTTLTRQVMLFPIGLCLNCGHTQVTEPYTPDIFARLYFSHNRQPDMWCSSATGQSPYQDMLDFIGPAVLQSLTSAADFGCGEALTLKLLQQQQPNAHYFGFDFNVSACGENIQGVQCDINKLEQVPSQKYLTGFDLILSSHVLEHVLQPVQFLQQLRRFLANDGYLFIEVPDCGDAALACALETTNLVHGQHIHYFTAATLQQCAALAGFSVLKVAHLRNGEIPRLQLLLQKADSNATLSKAKEMAAAAVVHRFKRYEQQLDTLNAQLLSALKQHGHAGLWGLGGDFYNLLQRHPALTAAITAQRLQLFDYELADHSFLDQRIHSSTAIATASMPIFMIPLYAPTQDKMQEVAKHWHNVINPRYI